VTAAEWERWIDAWRACLPPATDLTTWLAWAAVIGGSAIAEVYGVRLPPPPRARPRQAPRRRQPPRAPSARDRDLFVATFLLGVAGNDERAIRSAFHRQARTAHPDLGGSAADMRRLIWARDVLLAELSRSGP
jgi:hypothetical protein